MNQSCDVSSSCNGVCIVTRNVILSNSHAGTHADQPKHFEKNPIVEYFHTLQYNGACLVLNLVEELKNNLEISEEILRNAIEKSKIPKDKILRCIIKTRSNQPSDEQEWTNDFAHFHPSAAEYLSRELPNLLLIGIDTPSIDHPNKAPIIEHSHGRFWNARIAILENLNCEMIFSHTNSSDNSINSNNSINNSIEGYLQTSFNPLQISQDAIGCFVKFYPSHQ
ncbi:predicted protein [Naegleria gruberi]|uniref:Predicted protein n=1 Tax=Naegleria gruberi TaxID=5762 RepID=D2W350_NAEGR|nr:uncharacterized protein NAEGRDRAFT_75822 [Naegleria gruberi]EFC36554.1 predicted protein [Naegleria gruberi]|eukprot:XP_002669298.1 predicted protein [Naegleria gruberi strain NEG-M]